MEYYGLFYKTNGYFKSLSSKLKIFDEPGTAWTFKNQDEVMKSRFSFKKDLSGFQTCASFKDFLRANPWQAYTDKDIKEFVIFELKINNFLGIKKHSYIKKAFPSLFPEMDSFPLHELNLLEKVYSCEGVLALVEKGESLDHLSLDEYELNINYDLARTAKFDSVDDKVVLEFFSHYYKKKSEGNKTYYLFTYTDDYSPKDQYSYNLKREDKQLIRDGEFNILHYSKLDDKKPAYLFYSRDELTETEPTFVKID